MDKQKGTRLSVLMSVYSKELPECLGQALASLVEQTVPADEVVIVKDGQLGRGLEDTIAEFQDILPIRTLQIEKNVGLGRALNAGVLECSAETIARMDSDDVCAPDRFERQLNYLRCHPEVDLIGGAIGEFETDWKQLQGVRSVPEGGQLLSRTARSRNPMNHVSVMFRRSAVLAAGNYQTLMGFEDYFLWARMIMARSQIANLPEILVYVRCGSGMQARRGGLRYVKEELRFQWLLRKIGFLSNWQCALNILIRTPVRFAPTTLRAKFYNAFLRTTAPTPTPKPISERSHPASVVR
jgi:glycosyltransferase involved in cell wall biosynthesis